MMKAFLAKLAAPKVANHEPKMGMWPFKRRMTDHQRQISEELRQDHSAPAQR